MTLTLDQIPQMTMPQILRDRARQHDGSSLALREKSFGLWRPTTWAEYYAKARLTAIGLYALGFRPGDRLAIASDDTPEWYFPTLRRRCWAALGLASIRPIPAGTQYIVRHSRTRSLLAAIRQTDKS